MKDLVEGVDYIVEEGRVVFTALFHLRRGKCCGNSCRHCPYTKPCKKGNQEIEEEFANLKKEF